MPEIHPFIPADINGKWYINNGLHIVGPQPRPDWFVNPESFAFMPSKEVKSLFLGTFPTWEVVNLVRAGGNTEFFYGQRQNRFWPLLNLLSGLPTLTEVDQFKLLHKTNFGLTDILKKTNRNGKNSGDKDLLQPWIFNDLNNLKKQFQNLENIYCTSGGKSKITKGSDVNAARWLLTSLLNLGFNVTGFNVAGYQKHITVFMGNTVVWKFKLYILLSPSNGANTNLQGQVNNQAPLQALIAALPPAFAGLGDPIKLRVAQWAYLLSLGGFPLTPTLRAYILANGPMLALHFS
jgi:G:T/U-mismatch repair DNA glycosylase